MQSNSTPPQQQQRQDRAERDYASTSRDQDSYRTPPREYPSASREQDYPTPPREREYPILYPPNERDRAIHRESSNGEMSSGASSYDYHTPVNPQVHYPQKHQQQEYSPPSTPTRTRQFPPLQQQTLPRFHFPQSSSNAYGIPSPEPDVDTMYPRVPPKTPAHNFVTRPVTPPSEQKKQSKIGKLKRFSVLGKSKS
jgi:hypothetical protein